MGLKDLDEDAREIVREIAEKQFENALNAFNPCTATAEQAIDFLKHIAVAQLFGVDDGDGQKQFESARKNLVAKEKGEPSLECTGQRINFQENLVEGLVMVMSGEAFTCDGTNWYIYIEITGVVRDSTINTNDSLDFKVVDNTSGTLTLPTTGTLVTTRGNAAIIEPLEFKFTLREDDTVFVEFASTGAGTATTDRGDTLLWRSFLMNKFSFDLEPSHCLP